MPADEAAIFSRESVLGGLPARRASTLLFAIENRTALLTARARHAMARFETERTAAEREQSFLAALAGGRTPLAGLRIQDLDRHARGWADLMPPDPELRAAVLGRIVEKYGLPEPARELRSVLGAGDPAVIAAYQRQTGHPLVEADAVALRLPERARWWRAGVSRRLESLPPFWLAYALTLTETVGGGVLALPIAFARFGAFGAAVVLAFFGVVNALTVAALVESITRNGNMRYGTAYFGRLVGDFLGRPGNLVAMPALFALDAVGFLVALVGFGTTIGGATGLPTVVCAALLFAVVLGVLWRGAFDATVALAVAVGLINLGLIIVITVLAAGAAGGRPAVSTAGTGLTLDASLLEVMFGVALVAYFGHTSAGHAAKVVLAQDPSGRQFMAGNVAAILTAMVVYIGFVLAVTAAVGPDALAGYAGTALTPLAARVGPIVDAFGTVYVTLGVGLSAIYLGLGIFNQMEEVLAVVPFLRMESGPAARMTGFAVRAAPLVAIFVGVEALLGAGVISFTEPLNLVGTITLPLLGGVFPMLILAAARRRGERVPGWRMRWLGSRTVVVAILALYLGAVVAHALFIWSDPLLRVLAASTAVAMAVLIVIAWRRGSFVPRTIVELRADDPPGAGAELSVVVAGRGASHEHIADLAAAHEIPVHLPPSRPDELYVWSHKPTRDGDTEPLPIQTEERSPDELVLRPAN